MEDRRRTSSLGTHCAINHCSTVRPLCVYWEQYFLNMCIGVYFVVTT